MDLVREIPLGKPLRNRNPNEGPSPSDCIGQPDTS